MIHGPLSLAFPLLLPYVAGQTFDCAQADQTRDDSCYDLSVPDPSVPVLVSEVADWKTQREIGSVR
jgi:hypothetical protein